MLGNLGYVQWYVTPIHPISFWENQRGVKYNGLLYFEESEMRILYQIQLFKLERTNFCEWNWQKEIFSDIYTAVVGIVIREMKSSKRIESVINRTGLVWKVKLDVTMDWWSYQLLKKSYWDAMFVKCNKWLITPFYDHYSFNNFPQISTTMFWLPWIYHCG